MTASANRSIVDAFTTARTVLFPRANVPRASVFTLTNIISIGSSRVQRRRSKLRPERRSRSRPGPSRLPSQSRPFARVSSAHEEHRNNRQRQQNDEKRHGDERGVFVRSPVRDVPSRRSSYSVFCWGRKRLCFLFGRRRRLWRMNRPPAKGRHRDKSKTT